MRYQLAEFHRDIPDEDLVIDLQHVAVRLNRNSVTTRQYNDNGRFHSSTLMARFGTWTAVCARACLNVIVSRNIPDEELFRNLEEVWIRLGRQPRHREIAKPLSKYGKGTYAERFGSWLNALNAFIAYMDGSDIDRSEIDGGTVGDASVFTERQGPRTVNWRLRFIVMRRDNFKCKVCGRSPATDQTITLHVDHIQAWSQGGPTVLDNLQTLCAVCNIGKSDLEFLDSSTTEAPNVKA